MPTTSVPFDQRNGPVLHLARGERLGVDVADLLKFQTALERDGVVEAAANEEGVLGVCVLAGKPLDTPSLSARVFFDLLGQSLQLGDEVLSYWPSASVPRTRANSVASR